MARKATTRKRSSSREATTNKSRTRDGQTLGVGSRDPYKFKPEKQELFLKKLKETRKISAACEAVGLSRAVIRRFRKEHPDFEDRVQEAWMGIVDDVEGNMLHRAIHGQKTVKTVHKGDGTVEVHETHFYDNKAAEFVLKGRRPDLYGDKVEVSMTAEEFASNVRDLFTNQDEEADRATSGSD